MAEAELGSFMCGKLLPLWFGKVSFIQVLMAMCHDVEAEALAAAICPPRSTASQPGLAKTKGEGVCQLGPTIQCIENIGSKSDVWMRVMGLEVDGRC